MAVGDAAGCIYHHGAHVLAMPELESAALEDCAGADVMAAPFDIHDCVAQSVIDEPALLHHGAHAIYFEGDKVRSLLRATSAAKGFGALGGKAIREKMWVGIKKNN